VRPRRRRPVADNRLPARPSARINERINAKQVRLISETGEQLGIRPTAEALAYAEEQGLDLVEVAAGSDPPVCRVLDYGKWRYEEERKARAGRRNQAHVSLKEVRLRPKIGEHDYEWKRDRAVEFLQRRSKVKLVMQFRGREREHPERGRMLLERLAADVKEYGQTEGTPVLEGRTMTLVLAPKPGSG
jgi:translation initiation factor IF-3